MKCYICSNEIHNRDFVAKEMMFGFRDSFHYFECSNCGCVQINAIPANINKYYPNNYYSFEDPLGAPRKRIRIERILDTFLIKQQLGHSNPIGLLWAIFKESPAPWIKKGFFNYSDKILDVGCGNGSILCELNRYGFKNLTGIDPYINKDIIISNEVKIYKKKLEEVNETFDLIMFHHSFEHMEDPKQVLKTTYKLLCKNGKLIIRTPVANSYAWRKYTSSWVQLDPPRHFFLHTTKSIKLLADLTGFDILEIEYDSTAFQFFGSELYLLNIPLIEFYTGNNIFSQNKMNYFEQESKRLNRINDGDSACFYFIKP
jgi:SAM-dependent methyltransferase